MRIPEKPQSALPSAFRVLQHRTLVHRDVVGPGVFDLVLGIVLRTAMRRTASPIAPVQGHLLVPESAGVSLKLGRSLETCGALSFLFTTWLFPAFSFNATSVSLL
jgi:hypothetical protein